MKKISVVCFMFILLIVSTASAEELLPGAQYCVETSNGDSATLQFCLKKQELACDGFLSALDTIDNMSPLQKAYHHDIVMNFVSKHTTETGSICYFDAFSEYADFIDQYSIELEKEVERMKRKDGI